ncbi:MAG: hypothetical protein RR101_12635 [Burkholderiaceae bacterium]
MRALTLPVLLAALAAGASQAQVTDLPPALPPASSTAVATPAASPTATQRTRIELPDARPPAEAAAPNPPAADDGLVPTDAEMQAARRAHAPAPDRETRIVEVVQGKRVVEVIVTPGLTQRSYVMENRGDNSATTTPGASSGTLSVPRFLRLDF